MIAITSTGKQLNSLMDMRFARCPFFCLLKDAGKTTFLPNPFHETEGHIAPQVVQWLGEQGVTRLITGEIGSTAKNSLKEAKIQSVLIDNDKNTIQGILNKLK